MLLDATGRYEDMRDGGEIVAVAKPTICCRFHVSGAKVRPG